MEIIWQRKAHDAGETWVRLIMDDDGNIMFQCKSAKLPEWIDVDQLPRKFKFAV